MILVKRVVDLGRSLRAKHQIKIRQPLSMLTVITRNDFDRQAIDRGQHIIRDELNVKNIEFSTEEAKFIQMSVKPNLKTLGKKLGNLIGKVKASFESLSKNQNLVIKFVDQLYTSEFVEMDGIQFAMSDVLIERGPKDHRLIATEGGVTVLLDTTISDELLYEGYAREVVSRVQNLRKDSNLNVTDKISLNVFCPEVLKSALLAHKDYLLQETLGLSLSFDDSRSRGFFVEADIEGMTAHISLVKV
jgi:isoleucyl-tRNA synthetase